MPKDTVDITLSLFNNRREVTASLTHQVVPTDILIHHKGEKPTAYETIQQAADTTRCIHVAYIAEGYTDAEMDTFIKDVKDANEALFNHEPFKKMRDRFNVIAVNHHLKKAERANQPKESGRILHSTLILIHSIATDT